MNRIIGESGENPEQVRYCVRSSRLQAGFEVRYPSDCYPAATGTQLERKSLLMQRLIFFCKNID